MRQNNADCTLFIIDGG